MSKTKFTPGPWTVGDASECGYYVWDPQGERIVAEAYPDYNQDFEANAALIAAAPEMLEALELMLESFGIMRAAGVNVLGFDSAVEARVKAHNAIAKARGES